jgi:hypothetical protein
MPALLERLIAAAYHRYIAPAQNAWPESCPNGGPGWDCCFYVNHQGRCDWHTTRVSDTGVVHRGRDGTVRMTLR